MKTMDRARFSLLPVLAAGIIAWSSVASQAPGSAAPSGGAGSEPPVSEASRDDSGSATSARQLAKDWIKQKGWVRGLNPDGSYVSIGTASFNARSGRNALARAAAFERASLKAKNELAEFRSKTIETAVRSEMRRGTMPKTDDAQGDDLIEALATGAIKEASSSDPGAPIEVSEKFASIIRSAARSEVAGSTVSNTFEFEKGDGQGAFSVVMRFSPTSRQVARAALGQGDAPVNTELMEARRWADQLGESELARCYGARLMKDSETNEVVIVAFGQADVVGDSENAIEAAEAVAGTAADGALRQFVGELVESESTLVRATSMKEIDGTGLTATDIEAWEKTFKARAAGLDFQGATPIREWEGQLPGKRPVVGAVVLWSVSQSNAANALGREFDEIGASRGGSGRRNLPVGKDDSAPIKPKGRDHTPLTPGTKGPETPEP